MRGGKAAAAADEEEDEEEEDEEEEEEEKAATGACATKIEFLWKSQKVHEAEVCIAVLSSAAPAHSPCAPATRLFHWIFNGT